MQGCDLSIREDLLNKYAEMVNYCTMGSNNSIQDAPASMVDLLDKKEQESVQVEDKLDCLWLKLFV
jgi:hypothetical protein